MDSNGTPITTLRAWLDHLAAHGRLAVMRPGIGLKHELAAIAKRFDGRQVTFFPKPGGQSIPVVAGLVANREWIADALGVRKEQMLPHFQKCVENPIPWHEVGDAPVQQVVHRDVNITKTLPIATHNELDAGPYISAGLFITRNPTTGAQNVAICRAQVKGPNRLGVALGNRDTWTFQAMAEKMGKPLEVAIVIGVDPLTLLSSQVSMPMDEDELEVAGALHGSSLAVVKCLTKEIRVPAEAEIVLEGRFLPNVREPEGPFGEFTNTYGFRQQNNWVVEIDAITHRRDPIYYTMLGGSADHVLLGAVPREATFLALLRQGFPSISSVHLSRGGIGRYHLNVQMEVLRPGTAKNVILAALAVHTDVKRVVVVDQDVDITDPIDVEWAIATRFQADRDLVVVPGCLSGGSDPSSEAVAGIGKLGAKWGLDATKPAGADPMLFAKLKVPGETDVDLNAVKSSVPATDWRTLLS